MDELFKRHRRGDRWIAAVGLLVVGAIAVLIGGTMLVAHHVDNDSAGNQVEITKRYLEAQLSRMRQDLGSTVYTFDAPEKVITSEPQAIHNDYGKRLHTLSGHHRSYIINQDGTPIYASIDGVIADKSAFDVLETPLNSIVEDLRGAYAMRWAVIARAAPEGTIVSPPEPVTRVLFKRIDNRVALVGAVTILRKSAQEVADWRPAIAISLKFIDELFLNELAADLAIKDVSLQETEPASDGRSVVELPLGAQPAWLAWTPRKPGTAMLYKLAPTLSVIAVFMGLIGFLVLYQARRANVQLAESERHANQLAFRDTLTGLGNRAQLLEILSGQLEALGSDRKLALLFIDIDGFKDINNTLGHYVGDELLTVVAWRLASVKNMIAAVRLGGDEFAILITVRQDDEVGLISRCVLESLRQQTPAGDHVLSVTASIGVALAPDHGDDPDALLRRADIALYRARSEGRGTLRMFDPVYEDALHRRGKIERALSGALANDEFIVLFQPQFSADGERLVAVEALVRWNHPKRGIVPPTEFVPIAEHSGLIVRLDEWGLRRACEEAINWPEISLAVNLSPSNFHHSDMLGRLTRVLTETGFDPRRLEIEITENTLLNATPEVLGQLAEMRRMGIRIVLDDFGTGYSSLGYLRRFPVDKIKIDKSFVQSLGVTEEAAAIIECVARLGRALGLTITAEGVETNEQHRFVRAAGCHLLQGFLFSKAVTAEKIAGMLYGTNVIREDQDTAFLASA